MGSKQLLPLPHISELSEQSPGEETFDNYSSNIPLEKVTADKALNKTAQIAKEHLLFDSQEDDNRLVNNGLSARDSVVLKAAFTTQSEESKQVPG